MSLLSPQELDNYLVIRRNLGYALSTTEQVLRGFIAFAQQQNEEFVSTQLFLSWQDSFGQANQQTWSRRLGIIRLFAEWCKRQAKNVPVWRSKSVPLEITLF